MREARDERRRKWSPMAIYTLSVFVSALVCQLSHVYALMFVYEKRNGHYLPFKPEILVSKLFDKCLND